MLTVVEYVREDGSNPYWTWFDSLHAQAAAKVDGATRDGQHVEREVDGAIGEYRIDWGPATESI